MAELNSKAARVKRTLVDGAVGAFQHGTHRPHSDEIRIHLLLLMIPADAAATELQAVRTVWRAA